MDRPVDRSGVREHRELLVGLECGLDEGGGARKGETGLSGGWGGREGW